MVSIIVPVYNGEKTIRDCIYSLEKQSYKNFEIIIVDDGSQDGTRDICEQLQNRYGNIRVISTENGGVSRARNIGLQHAHGEYIQFVDSDDTVSFEYTEKMIHEMNADVDLVICGYKEVSHCTEECITAKSQTFSYKDAFFDELIKTNKLINSPVNKLFKKEIICSSFPEDLTLGEDLVFNLRYLKLCKKAVFIEDILYYYKKQLGTLSTTFNYKKYQNILELDRICCSEFELDQAYMGNLVSNLYDLFCIAAKSCKKNGQAFAEELCKNVYLHERLRAGTCNLDFKLSMFKQLIICKAKMPLFVLADILSKRKVIVQ